MNEEKLIPVRNKIYVFDTHTFVVFKKGSGIFQVDFKNYDFTSNKAIFLAPGQYFQLLNGDFELSLIKFRTDDVINTENSRFLFNHLIGLGYINLTQPNTYHLGQLQYFSMDSQSSELLSDAISTWLQLNPFCASQQETNLLFDIKEVVDKKFREPINVSDISMALNEKPYRVKSVARTRLNRTVKQLSINKLLLESKRKTIFTDMSTKEMAYDLGFSEPSYFNRFFKKYTDRTPYEFRTDHNYTGRDGFVSELMNLINDNYSRHHTSVFYADQLNMSTQNLAKKVRHKLNLTVHELIKQRLLNSSKDMLRDHRSIKSIAYDLGFKEANHFTAFFRKNTGYSPSTYAQDSQKVHSL